MIRNIPTLLVLISLISACSAPPPESNLTLDSIMKFKSEAELIAAFGPQVKRHTLGVREGIDKPVTDVFPGTNQELTIFWKEMNASTIERIEASSVPGDNSRKDINPLPKPWGMSNGIHLGLTLKETEALNGKPFFLYNDGSVLSWESGNLQPSQYETFVAMKDSPMATFILFEEIAKAGVTDKSVSSADAKLVSLNPVITRISVTTNFLTPTETAELAAHNASDSLAGVFFSTFIMSKKLQKLSLPLNLRSDSVPSGIAMTPGQFPPDYFKHPDHFAGANHTLLGILPDIHGTSVLWMSSLNGKTSPSITTFDTDGKFKGCYNIDLVGPEEDCAEDQRSFYALRSNYQVTVTKIDSCFREEKRSLISFAMARMSAYGVLMWDSEEEGD